MFPINLGNMLQVTCRTQSFHSLSISEMDGELPIQQQGNTGWTSDPWGYSLFGAANSSADHAAFGESSDTSMMCWRYCMSTEEHELQPTIWEYMVFMFFLSCLAFKMASRALKEQVDAIVKSMFTEMLFPVNSRLVKRCSRLTWGTCCESPTECKIIPVTSARMRHLGRRMWCSLKTNYQSLKPASAILETLETTQNVC